MSRTEHKCKIIHFFFPKMAQVRKMPFQGVCVCVCVCVCVRCCCSFIDISFKCFVEVGGFGRELPNFSTWELEFYF